MAALRLTSLNVGLPADFTGAEPWTSGIYKTPVAGRIFLSPDGLAGDGQADPTAHGGSDKALCVYSVDHYPFWREELGVQECGPGWFGENLSIEGLTETQASLGDTFSIGTAVVQISQPRAPCWKLGRRWSHLDMPKRVVQSGRTGWYLRVLQTGGVERGDVLTLVDRPHPRWTIDAVNGVAYTREGVVDRDAARELASCPALADAWRGKIRKLVE